MCVVALALVGVCVGLEIPRSTVNRARLSLYDKRKSPSTVVAAVDSGSAVLCGAVRCGAVRFGAGAAALWIARAPSSGYGDACVVCVCAAGGSST